MKAPCLFVLLVASYAPISASEPNTVSGRKSPGLEQLVDRIDHLENRVAELESDRVARLSPVPTGPLDEHTASSTQVPPGAETITLPTDFAYTQMSIFNHPEHGIHVSVGRVTVSGLKYRTDGLDGGFSIFDWGQGVALLTNHSEKTYSVSRMKKGTYDRFKQLTFTDSRTTPKLISGTTNVEGQDAIGYKSVTSAPEGKTTLVYWISTATNNVVLVDLTRNTANSTDRVIRSDFDYEPKLREAAFSVTPPQGYSEQPGPEIYVPPTE